MERKSYHKTYCWNQFFWQTVRIALCIDLIYISQAYFQEDARELKYFNVQNGPIVTIYSSIVGVLLYVACIEIFRQYMHYVHDAQMLLTYDALWLLDTPKNLAQMTGGLFFETFEFEKMKDHILEKTNVIHKCRSKLYLYCGLWHFK